MLILECSQGFYGRTDGSVIISLRNFVGEGIIKDYAERSLTRQQHVDKEKLNKCILKASVDTVGKRLWCLMPVFNYIVAVREYRTSTIVYFHFCVNGGTRLKGFSTYSQFNNKKWPKVHKNVHPCLYICMDSNVLDSQQGLALWLWYPSVTISRSVIG